MRPPIRTEAFLANLPLFRGLPADALARLAAGTSRRTLARGEVLFHEGESPTGLHAVVYGQLKLASKDATGRERLTGLVGAGRSFGEPVMFLDKPYIVTASALVDTLVLHVDKQTLFAELERHPAFARRIIGLLAQRVETLVHELQDRALGTGSQRFVAWLLRGPAASGDGPIDVALPAAKRVLAAQLNLSAEHLSRILRELADEKLIVVRGRTVSVPDRARLRRWQAKSAASPTEP